LRFARAIALITGLTGLPACSGAVSTPDSGNGGTDSGIVADSGHGGTDSGTPGEDAGQPGEDAGQPGEDAGPVADAGTFDCSQCDCGFSGLDAGTTPSCSSVGHEIDCCAAVGPLSPPDLAV
jgi:hypothetical protein